MARLSRCIILSVSVSLMTVLPAVQAAIPTEAISEFHATLTQAMARGPKLGCAGRLQLMEPAVEATFDLPLLAEKSLRRHWHTLDGAQRAAFVATLKQSIVTTYATEFSKPDTVRFAMGESEPLPNGDVLVHSQLIPTDRDALSLDYVLKPRGSQWRVVNVLADGVSDLALRAAQYDAAMKQDGLDSLRQKIEAQTQQMRTRCQ